MHSLLENVKLQQLLMQMKQPDWTSCGYALIHSLNASGEKFALMLSLTYFNTDIFKLEDMEYLS